LRKLQRDINIDIKNIKMLIFDVDGVLTDNRILFGSNKTESKFFSVADGFAIKMAGRTALKFAIISARYSEASENRCTEMGIKDIYQQPDKEAAFAEILAKYNLKAEEIAYLGNDCPDVLLFEKVGLAVCPADAEPNVLPYVHYQTEKKGGEGCCRELVEFVLKAQNIDMLELYRKLMKDAETRKRGFVQRG